MTTNEVVDIKAGDAYDMLMASSDAVLIDVRTEDELMRNGFVDLSSSQKKVYFIEWKSGFIDELEDIIENHNTTLFFMCAGGIRSKSAALEALSCGYSTCYNISDGFEGRRDGGPGWKGKQLPWKIKK